MCRVFANQPVDCYTPETRSIRIAGHATSIRLERAFWSILEEIAAYQGATLSRFLSTLYDEVLEIHGSCQNFASLLRCTCLKYASEIRGKVEPSIEAPELDATASLDSELAATH